MRKIIYPLSALTLLLLSADSWAVNANQGQVLKSFVSGSMAEIRLNHDNTDYIVNFWSIDCPPCLKELAMWQSLSEKYPSLKIIIVSTDTPDMKNDVISILDEHQVYDVESWQFNDSNTEKLRYEIDQNWYGEMPRTYFYQASGEQTAISGLIEESQIESWINRDSVKKESD